MKKVFFSFLAFSTIVLAACNNGGSKNKVEGHDISKIDKSTTQHATTTDDKDVKAVAVIYTNMNTNTGASIKTIVDHYLNIK